MAKATLRLHAGRKGRWLIGPAAQPEYQTPEPAHPAPNPPPNLPQQQIVVQSGHAASPPRTIVLTDDIDNNVVEYMAHHLAALTEASRDPIEVRIHCHGGELQSSWAIYDLLTTSPAPIVTMGFGFIGSGATIVFLAGSVRLLGENSKFFIHDPIFSTMGATYTEVQQMAKNTRLLRTRIARLYERESGQPHRQIIKWMREETSMTALQAIRRGFADRIIPTVKVDVELNGKKLSRPKARPKARKKRGKRR